jgi:hypothetical protein
LRRHAAGLAACASLALALGLVVYLTDRGASRAPLVLAITAFSGGSVFGVWGQWLPSCVHAFCFSLFSAAVMAPRSAPRYGACIAWGSINVAFELGQHPLLSAALAGALQALPEPLPLVPAIVRYFVRGTFDWGDIAACLVGALLAAAVLRLRQHDWERSHAQ